jgi:hypothetical protein
MVFVSLSLVYSVAGYPSRETGHQGFLEAIFISVPSVAQQTHIQG